MVGFIDVLVHGVVRQVPEGGPLSGRLPFQSVYPAVERAVGQVVVDGGLRGSPMIDGRIIGKTANSSQGSHHHGCGCRIHAGDRVLKGAGNSATGNPLGVLPRWSSNAELAPTGASRRPSHWNVQSPRDGPAGTGLLLARKKFLAVMCQNVSSGHEEICFSSSKRFTFKSTGCQPALTRRFNLHQRKPREFPLVFNCGLVWPPLPARRLSDTRDGPGRLRETHILRRR